MTRCAIANIITFKQIVNYNLETMKRQPSVTLPWNAVDKTPIKD